MNFDEFVGQVQHRVGLPDTGRALRTVRATLLPLGERIPEGNAEDIAANLPLEIKWYLTGAVHEHGQRFDWQEYLRRVSEIDQSDPPEAAYRARIVVDLVREEVPPSDFEQLRNLLPEHADDENWGKLFEVVDSGGWQEQQDPEN